MCHKLNDTLALLLWKGSDNSSHRTLAGTTKTLLVRAPHLVGGFTRLSPFEPIPQYSLAVKMQGVPGHKASLNPPTVCVLSRTPHPDSVKTQRACMKYGLAALGLVHSSKQSQPQIAKKAIVSFFPDARLSEPPFAIVTRPPSPCQTICGCGWDNPSPSKAQAPQKDY